MKRLTHNALRDDGAQTDPSKSPAILRAGLFFCSSRIIVGSGQECVKLGVCRADANPVARLREPVSPAGSVGASACGRGLHWRPAPRRRRFVTQTTLQINVSGNQRSKIGIALRAAHGAALHYNCLDKSLFSEAKKLRSPFVVRRSPGDPVGVQENLFPCHPPLFFAEQYLQKLSVFMDCQ